MRLIALAVFVILYSCKHYSTSAELPANPLDTSKLYGRWMVIDALRNNRPTQTITGAVFALESNQISHNLSGTENLSQFDLKDSTLYASDQTQYKIEYLNDSLLILYTLIQNNKFRMSLKKLPDYSSELTESDTSHLKPY